MKDSLQIAYVAGRHPSLNRRLQYLRAAVQQAAEPFELIPVRGAEFGHKPALIVDLTATSPEIEAVVTRLRFMTDRPHTLFIHLSDFFGLDDEVREALQPIGVRNAHHSKLIVERFIATLPGLRERR